jgi:hypothetical protein
MKRNKILSFATRCVSATLLFFFLLAAEGYTQQVDFCGEFHKTSNPVPTDSIYYTDRFGNYYTESELEAPSTDIVVSAATAGSFASIASMAHCIIPNDFIFDLRFPPGELDVEMETIVCAMIDLSNRLNIPPASRAHLPIIRFTRDGLPDVAAHASGFYASASCTGAHSAVWEKLYTNIQIGLWNRIDAVITYDNTTPWTLVHQPPDGNLDLFFATQHEALHALGIASTILWPNAIASKWDQLLFDNDINHYLLTSPAPNCRCHGYTLANSTSLDHYISPALDRCNATNIVVGCNSHDEVNTTFATSNAGTLSHLCDGGGNTTLMAASADFGFDDKRIRDVDLRVLSALGYDVRATNIPRPNFNITDAVDIFLPDVMPVTDNSISVNLADIRTSNGLPTNSTLPVNIVFQNSVFQFPAAAATTNMGLITLALKYQTTSGNGANRRSLCGTRQFEYTIEIPDVCDPAGKTYCKRGRLFLFIDCAEVNPCVTNDCNLICDGNINNLQQLGNNLDLTFRSNFDVSPVENFEKNRTVEFGNGQSQAFCNIGLNPNVNNSSLFLSFSQTPVTQVQNNPNAPVIIVPGLRNPGFYFRLKKPLAAGRHYRLRYRKLTSCTGRLNFVFTHGPPCQPLTTMGFLTQSGDLPTDCPQTQLGGRQAFFDMFPANTNTTWNTRTVSNNFVPSADGVGADFLIVFLEPNNATPDVKGINLDDFELEDLDDAKITIAPSVQNFSGCIGGQATINFTITNTAGLAGDFVLTPRLPAGLTLASSTNTGTVHINASNPNIPTTITSSIVVNIPAGTSSNAVFNVFLDFASRPAPAINNACLVSSASARLTVQAATPVLATIGMSAINCQNLILDLSASSSTAINASKVWSIRKIDNNNAPFVQFSTIDLPSINFGQAPYVANAKYEVQLIVTLTGTCTTTDTKTVFVDTPDCNLAPLCTCPPSSTTIVNIVDGNVANPDNGEVLLSSITQLSGNQKTNTCITVRGTLVIDKPFTFHHCNFVMQPGARIRTAIPTITPNNPRLFKLQDCNMASCSKRWRGVEVGENTFFQASENDIRDAEAAITLNGGVTGYIYDNFFDKNYVSIDIIGSTAFPDVSNIIQKNTIFGSDGGMLPAWITTNSHAQTLSGIRIRDASANLGLFGFPGSENAIFNARQGIYTESATVSTNYLKVTNSLGISATRVMHTDPGAQVIDHTGVYSIWSHLGLNKTILRNLGQGIRLWTNYGFSIGGGEININEGAIFSISSLAPHDIDAIDMSAYFSGIRLYGATEGVIIYPQTNTWVGVGGVSNKLSSTSFGHIFRAESYVNAGIDAYKGIDGPAEWQMSTDFNGLELINEQRYALKDITITYNAETNKKYSGVALSGSIKNKFTNVQVQGLVNSPPVRTQFGKGFAISNSANNVYCCSRVSRLSNGFDFIGGCQASKVRLTKFDNNMDIGLFVESGKIGEQKDMFNRFTQSNPTYTAVAAKHFSTIPSVLLQSNFIVGTNFNPPANLVTPNVGWFDPNGSNTSPSCITDDCPLPEGYLRSSTINDRSVQVPNEIKFYSNGVPSGFDHPSFYQWQGGRWALDEIEEHPEWLGEDPSVDAYYVNTFNSNIRRFNDIDKLINQFNRGNSLQKAQLASADNQIKVYNAQINVIESAVGNKTLSFQDSITKMAERKSLLKQRYEAFSVKKVIYTAIKEQKNTLLTEAEFINQYLSPQNVFEQNEKKVNEIYFRSLARDIYHLDASDEQVIRALAMKCPMEAGNAVFKARVLHSLFQYKTFDDSQLCTPSIEGPIGGKIAANKVPNGNDVQLFPNPTSDILNIRLAIPCKVEIVLRNISGGLIQQISATEDTQLSLQDVPNGIIFAEVWSNGKRIDTKKIIVLH